jgi:hypothetical protein
MNKWFTIQAKIWKQAKKILSEKYLENKFFRIIFKTLLKVGFKERLLFQNNINLDFVEKQNLMPLYWKYVYFCFNEQY